VKIVKYQAANMKEALAKVKRELGPEAMVVATRQVRRGLLGTGVEVTAAIDVETSSGPELGRLAERPRRTGLDDSDVERIMAPLRSELRSLRSLVRASSESRPQAPDSELREEMAAMRRTLDLIKAEATGRAAPETVVADHQIVAASVGRVVALVGPTGVGKTTTIAKLAARAALVDRRSVALVTLDTYRVGGEQQMRVFADLIGIPLHLCADPAELTDKIDQLENHDLVYIDTAGRSPRDLPAIAALQHALHGIDELEVHLALALDTPPTSIDGICARYRPVGIDRLLFTKLDEAGDMSQLIEAPARLSLPIAHITTGQRVPEDIEDATTERLLELAQRGLGDIGKVDQAAA
jgi:flagellar biosynthesis protein FlhF